MNAISRVSQSLKSANLITLKLLASATVAILGTLILLTRILGLGPRVMGDELTYSTFSRLLPISESPVPNYLYLWVFSSTNACGPEFYSCARLLNVFFVLVTAVFVYLIARRFLSFGVSLFFSATVVVGPVSMYSAHFMPDSMFFAFATAFVWLLLRASSTDLGVKEYLILGVAIGVVSLVKPHGLFLLAALPALVICSPESSRSRLQRFFVSAIVSTGAALLVKLGIGFITAGENGLALFRSAYGEFVPAVQGQLDLQDSSQLSTLTSLPLTIQNLILAVCVLFLVPVFATASAAMRSKSEKLSELQALSIVLIALLATFVAAVAVFSFQLGSIDATQTLRVQLRYFEFLLILFSISALAYSKTQHKSSSWIGAFAAISIAGLSLIWWFDYSKNYLHVYSDATFLPMLVRFFEIGTPIALVAFSLALLWGIKRDWAIKGWVFGLFPLLVLISIPAMYFDDSIRNNSKPTHVVAAEFAAGTLSDDQLSQLVVVGASRQEVDASRFIIGNPNIRKRVVSQPSEFDIDSLPPRISWALLLGYQSASSNALQIFEGRGFQLIARDRSDTTYFDLANPGGAVLEFLGFENRGSHGTWTTGQLSVVVLMEPPLPGKEIDISFLATPDLVGKTVVFSLGEEEIQVPIEVAGEAIEVVLTFQNQAGYRDLAIFVPDSEPRPGTRSGLRFLSLSIQ
jgi:phosphoglycerol transferase